LASFPARSPDIPHKFPRFPRRSTSLPAAADSLSAVSPSFPVASPSFPCGSRRLPRLLACLPDAPPSLLQRMQGVIYDFNRIFFNHHPNPPKYHLAPTTQLPPASPAPCCEDGVSEAGDRRREKRSTDFSRPRMAKPPSHQRVLMRGYWLIFSSRVMMTSWCKVAVAMMSRSKGSL
jgi:hypothetical protein